jgi:hypothetical protein
MGGETDTHLTFNQRFYGTLLSSAFTVIFAFVAFMLVTSYELSTIPEWTLFVYLTVGGLSQWIAGLLTCIFDNKRISLYWALPFSTEVIAGAIHYMYLLSSIDIWGIAFLLCGIGGMYYTIRRIRKFENRS